MRNALTAIARIIYRRRNALNVSRLYWDRVWERSGALGPIIIRIAWTLNPTGASTVSEWSDS
jgi:hypothetical protein